VSIFLVEDEELADRPTASEIVDIVSQLAAEVRAK
jgi:hypothetical protein